MMIGLWIRHSIVHNNNGNKKSKETGHYEKGIKGTHFQGNGCWKCPGGTEHNVGSVRGVLPSARALAM